MFLVFMVVILAGIGAIWFYIAASGRKQSAPPVGSRWFRLSSNANQWIPVSVDGAGRKIRSGTYRFTSTQDTMEVSLDPQKVWLRIMYPEWHLQRSQVTSIRPITQKLFVGGKSLEGLQVDYVNGNESARFSLIASHGVSELVSLLRSQGWAVGTSEQE